MWGAVNMLQRRVSPALRAYLRLTFLAIAGHRPAQGLHWFYGPAVLLSLPVAWSFASAGDERREALALTGGALAVFLFSIRAIGTGG